MESAHDKQRREIQEIERNIENIYKDIYKNLEIKPLELIDHIDHFTTPKKIKNYKPPCISPKNQNAL